MLDLYGQSLVTAPAEEPVSLAEAKAHCRVEIGDDDTYLSALIRAARQLVEVETGRALVSQTWRLTLDYFTAWEIRLPKSPLVSVSSVQYVDSNGDTQTLSTTRYSVLADRDPGMIEPAYGYIWPLTRDQSGAVTITYVAGYGAASAVPETAKLAIKLAVGHWYEHRESVIVGVSGSELPLAFRSLCQAIHNGEYA